MNINEILKQQGNVQLVVSAADLKESIIEWGKEMKAEMQGEPDENIPIEDAMRLLKVSYQTIWRWQKFGVITPIKIGRKRFFKKSEIDRILESGAGH